MEVARVLNEAGLLVIAAFVAPEAMARDRSRALVGGDRFFLVHLSAPLAACRAQDRSRLYKDADEGRASDVPGVSFPYEAPLEADLTLPSHEISAAECADRIVAELTRRGRLV